MSKTIAQEIIAALEEALAYERGELKPAKVVRINRETGK